MATYVPITQEEAEEFLLPQGFQQIALPGTKELVYAKRVDADGLVLSLRVYTGINPNGQSRDVGKDAMRCNIFWRKDDGELKKVATSKRVHRVAGWRKNLQSRLDELKIERKCSDCGSPMVERKGQNGKFLGCASFPACRHTERIQ
jgi:hypothetical protein